MNEQEKTELLRRIDNARAALMEGDIDACADILKSAELFALCAAVPMADRSKGEQRRAGRR